MQTNFQKLHVERKIWKCHNRNEICLFFLCVNDDKGKPSSHQFFLSWDIAQIGGKIKINICFTKIGKLYICNNFFWVMDVQWGP
jgi:hypothetical protein